jgi:hypothetical protein
LGLLLYVMEIIFNDAWLELKWYNNTELNVYYVFQYVMNVKWITAWRVELNKYK